MVWGRDDKTPDNTVGSELTGPKRAPLAARQAGLAVLADLLGRDRPGVRYVFGEVEADDRSNPTRTRKVSRPFAAPKDPRARTDRIDVAATTSGAPDKNHVDHRADDLPPIVDREG